MKPLGESSIAFFTLVNYIELELFSCLGERSLASFADAGSHRF